MQEFSKAQLDTRHTALSRTTQPTRLTKDYVNSDAIALARVKLEHVCKSSSVPRDLLSKTW